MIYAEKHLSLLSRMGRDGLQLRFTGEFPEEILDQTCKKIEDMGLQEQIRKEEATQIQRELIQVPEFAELYQALCAHGIAVSVIQTMLHAASSYQEHLSQYPKEQVLEAAVLDLKPSLKFEYMKHYQPLVRYEEEEQAVADNLDIQLVERLAQEFVNDLFSTLRERMLDLRYCKVVFVGGGAILLRRQIEDSGKVGTPLFVTNINANAAGFEYLYRLETVGR